MKFKTIILFITLSLFVAQPANILKAVSLSDVLGKAQELAEKQKIKGKKLEKFILNNVITIDYEGKKQSYKFNKDTTYEVYEGKKVVGDGTWAIKGLTKNSIKLSEYRDIYFQIYKAKDRISTLTNLKKDNDEQTNRKILRIASLSDFEKQPAQVEPKEEKKKVVEKKEIKKEEKKVVEKKEIKKEEKKVVEKKEIKKEEKAEEKTKKEYSDECIEGDCYKGQGTFTWTTGNKYVGEFKDGNPYGQGTMEYAYGSKYVGEFDGRPNGQGTMEYANGSKYVGEFKNGSPRGQGTFTYANGDKFVGGLFYNYNNAHNYTKEQLKSVYITGTGTHTYANGDIYVGTWRYGEPYGQATLTYVNGDKYDGEFYNGVLRQGTFTWADGNKYVGEFKRVIYVGDKGGMPDGQGTFTWADGNKYVGEWKDGKQHGQGTFTFADGTVEKGIWENGELAGPKEKRLSECIEGNCVDGQGTYTWANDEGKWTDGSKYVGEWKYGRPDGQGTFTWGHGDKYVGELKAGIPHGQGTYTYADPYYRGREYVGGWKDGRWYGYGTLTCCKTSSNPDGIVDKGIWEGENLVEEHY